MKRTLPVAIAVIFILTLAAAWVAYEQGVFSAANGVVQKSANSKSKDICVVQYVSHPLLDAVYAGFLEELDHQGYSVDNVSFHNANGDPTAASLLADKVCQQKCRVVFALATPMAQSVKSACPNNQPILFGAITDPVTAGLVNSMQDPGGNLTGTSDQWPYELQMQLIARLWGNDARVGVPYNPAEANTQYAMDRVRSIAKRIVLNLVEVPINTVTEASQAVDAFANKVDLIYVPADNTAVAAAPGIVSAADRHELPVFAGDPGTFNAGAIVGLGVDYTNLGIINANQARDILEGGSPSEMPVQISNQPKLLINTTRLRNFGFSRQSVNAAYQSLVEERS